MIPRGKEWSFMDKECKSEGCTNRFVQYKSTDKYCSAKCAAKHYKPLKRTPLKQTLTPISKKPSAKKVKFENEFNAVKQKLIAHIKKQHGELCCEKCFTKHSISFSVHHIVYRSEKPNHISLNHPKNLIYLCYNCHESFHSIKTSRNYLVRDRGLEELFQEPIWGCAE